MALDRQVLPVPFAGGIDTKTDPKQVSVGKLTTLENGLFTSLRRLTKRAGTAAISGGLTAGTNISAFGANQLVALDGQSLYATGSTTDNFTKIGDCPAITLSRQQADGSRPGQENPSAAYHAASGLTCVVTRNIVANTAQYIILRQATGVVAQSGMIDQAGVAGLTAINSLSVHALGAYFIIVMGVTGGAFSTKYYSIPITGTTPGAISAATNVGPLTTNGVHAAAVSGSSLVIASGSTSSLGSIVVTTLSSALVLGTPVTLTPPGAPPPVLSAIGLTVDGTGNVAVSFKQLGVASLYVTVLSGALAVLASNVVVYPALGATNENVSLAGYAVTGGINFIASQYDSAANRYTSYVASLSSAWAASGSPSIFSNTLFTTAPFVLGGSPYVAAAYASSVQPTYFIVKLPTVLGQAAYNPQAPVARIFTGEAGLTAATHMAAPSAAFIYGTSAVVPLLRAVSSSGTALNTTTKNITELVSVSFGGSQSMLELGKNLFVSQSGFLRAYDGEVLSEQGFHTFPEIESVTPSGAAGPPPFPGGNYQYVIVWEWVDAQGQRHQSSPSQPVQVTQAGAPSATIVVRGLPFTARLKSTGTTIVYSTIEAVIYRTLANGQVFYRVSGLGTAPPANFLPFVSGGQPTYTFTDNYADNIDTKITTNPGLYTAGGVLDNIPAPSCTAMTAYRNRLIVVDELNPLSAWYSQQVIPGSPVEFSDFLVQNIDSTGGIRLTGLAWLDDKLLLFKDTVVFYMTGSGPDARGQSSDFSTPTIINTNSGCKNPLSIVTGANGVVYQSYKGFFILDRALSDHYIGAEAEGYNSATVYGAAIAKDANQIRWALSGNVVLMYDFLVGQWGIFPNVPAVGSTIYNGKYTYITATGAVLQETPGSFADSGAIVPLKAATGWLSFAGLAGYQRVYKMVILGEYKSSHALQVDIAVDYDDTIVQTMVIYPDNLTGATSLSSALALALGGGRPAYEYRVRLKQQKCQAIKVTITELAGVGVPSEGLSLSGLTFEVGVLPNVARLAAGQTVG